MADKPSSSAMTDLLWFVAIMVLLGAFWVASGGPARYENRQAPSQTIESPLAKTYRAPVGRSFSRDEDEGASDSRSIQSAAYHQVRLGRGTASSAEAADAEYITLAAPSSNSAPVNVTGWFLTNNQGNKLVLKNSRLVEQPSVRLALPSGAQLFAPDGKHRQGPIVLEPGDRAYVITGDSKPYGDYRINTSFRVNKCLGYVEEANKYDLVPPLASNSCPEVETEFNLSNLPQQCYDYVHSVPRCHVPKITNKEDEGWRVDGRSDVPKTCVNLVLPYLSYESCVNRHLGDADFFKNEWRIYLKQKWPMWDRERETITLSDQNGNIVDRLTY